MGVIRFLCFYCAFRFKSFPWLACFLHSSEKPFGVCKDEHLSNFETLKLNIEAICYVHCSKRVLVTI